MSDQKKDETVILNIGSRSEPAEPSFEEGKTEIIDVRGDSEPLRRGIKTSFVLLHGQNAGQEYVIKTKKTLVGRGKKADLILPISTISSLHAELLFINDSFRLRDLGSRNGTFINGIRIGQDAVELMHGDKIAFAEISFQFLLEEVEEHIEFEIKEADLPSTPERAGFVEPESTAEKLRTRIGDLSALSNRIVDALPAAITVIDKQMRIVTASAGFLRMFHFKDPSSIKGASLAHVLPWLGGGVNLPDVIACFTARPDKPVQFPKLKFREENEERVLNLKAMSLIPVKGRHLPEFFLLLLEDVTEEEKFQEKSENYKRQLFQADKMALLGTLTSGIAHDINNCIAFMRSNLEILKQMIPPGAGNAGELNEIVEDLRKGVEKTKAISDSIKRFSHPGKEKIEPIDVNDTLRSAAKIALPEIKKKASFVEQLSEVKKVNGNEVRLEQAFVNLLMNAAQSVKKGVVLENTISVFSFMAGNNVIVEIRDTGCGIPKENLQNIFKPFFTNKERGIGTGLGLSIVSEIVALHSGRIEVESEVGRGSIFRMILPVV